jgi:hypothetical protein
MILRDDNEKPDPRWTQRAGERGFYLAEALQSWSQAVNIYIRLTNSVWPLVDVSLQKHAAEAFKNLERDKSNR